MEPSPQSIRRIYHTISKTPGYKATWRARQIEIPRWRTRLKRALADRGTTMTRDLIALQFSEKPIQTLDSRHLAEAISDPRRLKDSLAHLVDSRVSIEVRFTDLLDWSSRFRIRGLGIGVLSEWLMFMKPDQFGIWNNKSRKGLVRLGLMPTFEWGLSWGDRYTAVNLALQELRFTIGAANLAEVDLFLHYIGTPEPVARAAWKRIVGEEMPSVSELGAPWRGGGADSGSDHLSETGYTRRTRAEVAKVEKLHSKLSNRMKKWLESPSVRAYDVRQEHKHVDLHCTFNHETHLFELKIISDLGGPQAGHYDIRAAIGQLLDYTFYPTGAAKYDRLAIVTDIEPRTNDLLWVKALGFLVRPIEVFWYPIGASRPVSPCLTQNPLARKAIRFVW